jgi:hypothetical protein
MGCSVGWPLGDDDGCLEGLVDGQALGWEDGLEDGCQLGLLVG